MPISTTRDPRSSRQRRVTPRSSPLWRVGMLGLLALILAGGTWGARWYWTRRSLGWQVRCGLEELATADTPQKLRNALDRWEAQTAPNWQPRLDDFINLLFREYPLEDQRVRLLLARVAGADYGNRREDWQRWYDAWRRRRQGAPLQVPRKEAVALKPRWVAPVGLTAWFTTVLPLDGQVYVASLGESSEGAGDPADGVVRVDGASGAAELFFTPPLEHRGPRDVIGIAAGDDGLLVACYNGSVYYVGTEGRVVWHTHVGDPLVGPPLAADANQDGVTDAVIVTRAAKVICLNGRQGKTTWVTTMSRPAPGAVLLGATLALGNVLGQDEPELVVTLPAGQIEVLALRTGRSLWRHELAAGSVAGAICGTGDPGDTPPAYAGDRTGSIWSFATGGRSLEAVRCAVLATRRDETLVAALRTLSNPQSPISNPQSIPNLQSPIPNGLLLAGLTGDYATGRGGLCALTADSEYWRLPLEGAIWATPAVADLNGDGRAEIVVATIEPRKDGITDGALTVVSAAGHVVQRIEVDAPIECSPVVADVDGDGRLEVLVADQSGRLHCFATEGFGPVEWGQYGGDSHNTRNAVHAYDYGQRPYGYQWQWKPRGTIRNTE